MSDLTDDLLRSPEPGHVLFDVKSYYTNRLGETVDFYEEIYARTRREARRIANEENARWNAEYAESGSKFDPHSFRSKP